MRSLAVKILLIAIPVLILGSMAYRQLSLDNQFQEISRKINNFTAIDVENGRTTFQELKGKATFIVLSASWCPACMAEIPMLKNIHNEFANQGLNILMINEDDNVKIAAKFKKKHELPWTVLHWNYDLMNLLGNPGFIPVSYLVNDQDSIVQIHAGIFKEEEVRKEIQKLLK